jgi:hypothetical protein
VSAKTWQAEQATGDGEDHAVKRGSNGKMGRSEVDIGLANHEDMVLARNQKPDPARVRRKRIQALSIRERRV